MSILDKWLTSKQAQTDRQDISDLFDLETQLDAAGQGELRQQIRDEVSNMKPGWDQPHPEDEYERDFTLYQKISSALANLNLDKQAQMGDTPSNDFLRDLPSPHEQTPEDENIQSDEETEEQVEEDLSLSPDTGRDMILKVDGEDYEVSEISAGGYLTVLTTEGGDYYIAIDSEIAGLAARQKWEDMVQNDPAEFIAIIGEERLLQWAMGQSDSLGISNVKEFLDVIQTVPEESFATHDGVESAGAITEAVAERLGADYRVKNGWADCVAYGAN